jgi:hypothetical protein
MKYVVAMLTVVAFAMAAADTSYAFKPGLEKKCFKQVKTCRPHWPCKIVNVPVPCSD